MLSASKEWKRSGGFNQRRGFMNKTCVTTFAARVDSSHFFIQYLHICLAVFLFSSIVMGNTIHVPADYATIQAAINASVNGDTIIVSSGTYFGNINFNEKNIILTSTNSEDPVVVASTIIDGNANGSAVKFSGTETSACVLRGFTITNGMSYSPTNSGGGIYGCGTQATIANCTISGNKIWCDLEGSYPSGGGLSYCNGIIDNCIIINNEACHGDGGGLFHCDGMITNCLIAGNEATWGAGLDDCNGTIINCTIVDNNSTLAYGGLSDCNGTITNCIIWQNIIPLYRCSIPSYSCIQNWTGGTGNISSNPLFADPNNLLDYHLKSQYGRWDTNQWVYDEVTSPCIDTGDPNSDWKEELWPHGGRINMGAYGGTPQASMSANPVGNIADLNHDDAVDLDDLALFCQDWLHIEYLLDTDLNRNGAVDIADFAVFAQQWLWENEAVLSLSRTLYLPVGFIDEGNPDPETLTVSNLGMGILNWEIDTTGKPDWLTMAPTSGSLDSNESESITLSVDIAGLADGLYSYSFDVLDPATQNSRQTISLHLFMTDIIGDIFYVPVDFPTIQKAINAVATGNTIVVLPGTYTENITLNSGTILVGSASVTFINGNQAGSVITAAGCERNTLLNGFTITNGNADKGGGMYIDDSRPTIRNCIFSNNTAQQGGGIFFDTSSNYAVSPLVTNCMFINNSADSGGGITDYNCAPILTNCTFSGNVAAIFGGAIADITGMKIQNCILWGNTAAYVPATNEIYASTCTPQIYNSNITGCCNANGQWILSPSWDYGGNIDQNPLFVDPNNPNQSDYHLQSLSPCIDAGTNTPIEGLPAADLDGIARIYDGDNDGHAVVDMGAYEVVGSDDACLYVTPNSLSFSTVTDGANSARQNIIIQNVGVRTLDWLIDTNSLPDWLTVTPTSGSLMFGGSNKVTLAVDANGLSGGQYLYELQVDGGRAQNSPQTVTVTLSVGGKIYLNGAYYPTIQAAINASSNGQLVLVGDGIFAGEGNRDIEFKGKAITLRSENGPEHCIIDCQATELDQHRGFYIHEGETVSSIIDGFTIKNGVIMNTGGNSYGAAIFCQFTSPTIKNCIITQCTSWLSVIYCTNYFQPSVGAKFINCTIKDNITAIGISDSSPVISDCVIINNDLDGEAGIDCSHSAPTINNCIIAENYGGSGISCGNDSCPIITNCKIIGNSGYQGAGLFFIDCTSSCQPQIINSLIAGNTAAGRGGGIGTANSNYTISILNCTIIGNSSGEYGGGIYRSGNSSFEVRNSILWGNTAGISGHQLYTGIMPTYSCIQGWTGGGTGNISSDPLFADTSSGDPADWDLHLLPASPCIDTGTNTPSGGLPTTDIEGNPRIIDGDSNGSAIVDMGICEYIP
jgi:hypothetical protein